MDARTELLVIMMEECGELIQACSKALRKNEFEDNRNLIEEVGDVYTMIEIMHSFDLVSWNDIEKRVLEKEWLDMNKEFESLGPVEKALPTRHVRMQRWKEPTDQFHGKKRMYTTEKDHAGWGS